MRTKSKGQGVPTSMHEPTQATTDSLSNNELQAASEGVDGLSGDVVVDPSLENGVHGLRDGPSTLETGPNGLGDTLVQAEGDSSSFHPTMFSTSLGSNTYLRGSFPFVNGTGATAGSSSAIPSTSPAGDDAESDAMDNQTRHSGLVLRTSNSPDPDTGDAQARALRLPPILQVEKQHVTTTATQAASATRRKNEAVFKCPVPGCGSTFTRRFNLRGHLRSHTEERPFVCEWPGCGKGFARSHDCKRHTALHTARHNSHGCAGCGKTFSRTDALNRHLKSEVGAPCREFVADQQAQAQAQAQQQQPPPSNRHASTSAPEENSNTSPAISISQIDVDSTLRPVPFAL